MNLTLKRTPLYHQHLKLGARMINFANWEMPLDYGSQVKEHHDVRNAAGVFDVSHMAVIDIGGQDAKEFLRRLLANDLKKLVPGRALYSCMLNLHAGVLDDLIVYCLDDLDFRMVVNAATTEKDIAWLNKHAKSYGIKIHHRQEMAMLAIQGPATFEKIKKVFEKTGAILSLKPFQSISQENCFIARTGYTGEDGIEIILPEKEVSALWQKIITADIKPAGLGARDSLRLEAGYNLYGTDMDESVTPLDSNLGWTIDWGDPARHFIGKEALLEQLEKGVKHQLVGIVLLAKGICRSGMTVYLQNPGEEIFVGKLTSGGYSPTLDCSIGLARIPSGVFSDIQVEVRGKKIPAKIVKPPFVYHGKPNFTL